MKIFRMKVFRFLPVFGLLLNVSVALAAGLDVPQIAWRDVQQGPLIGKGSFGDVYGGKWQEQEIAIKVLQIGTLPTPQIQREFDEEVRVMWTCQFPRILKLHGVCTEPGHCAMVMEKMRGSLHGLLHSGEDISEPRRLQIAIDIAQGLGNLHSRSVLHRDLKSQNILLDHRGRAKICDFGLAKLRTNTSTLTARRAGTLRWCAPEQLSDEPRLTPAADIYSYGMILWELITRKAPFAFQPNDAIVMGLVLGGRREKIPDDCPSVWAEIITACWQQAPEQRPTAEAILARLTALRPAGRPVWLPEEEPQPSAIRADGFVVYPASQEDWQKVLQCYGHHAVPGYDVGKVEVIFNPDMNQRFAAQKRLLQQRQGNPRYVATWKQEPQATLRAPIHQYLEALAEPHQEDEHPDVKLLPLWHGTQKGKLPSILSAGYGAFGDTDEGYFGKGIYATHEAAYAQMYANQCGPTHRDDGVLILNWGITHSSYPIIRQDYDPLRKQLVRRIEHPRYDSHCIPVVPGTTPVDYVPITPPERHQYTEVVFFDTVQVLPRYMITLQATLPSQGFVMREALREKEAKKAHEEEAARRRTAAAERARWEEEHQRQVAAQARQIEDLRRQMKDVEQARQEAEERTRQVEAEWRRQAMVATAAASLPAASTPPARRPAVDGADRGGGAAGRPALAAVFIPPIAQGYEAIYQRFIRGVLIYRPNGDGNDAGRINLPIAALANPLEGTFDLSGCGDTGQYLSISTGYRKRKNPANASKSEIWLAPRFVIEREQGTTAKHFGGIMSGWNEAAAPVGIFFTWGGWDDLGWYDYLTTESMDLLGSQNLYDKYRRRRVRHDDFWPRGAAAVSLAARSEKFHVHFVN